MIDIDLAYLTSFCRFKGKPYLFTAYLDLFPTVMNSRSRSTFFQS